MLSVWGGILSPQNRPRKWTPGGLDSLYDLSDLADEIFGHRDCEILDLFEPELHLVPGFGLEFRADDVELGSFVGVLEDRLGDVGFDLIVCSEDSRVFVVLGATHLVFLLLSAWSCSSLGLIMVLISLGFAEKRFFDFPVGRKEINWCVA